MSQKLHLPYTPLLKKIKATKQQAGLTRDERLKNLHHAFVPVRDSLNMNIVLLVDDVTTTRTTLNECARVLKNAGVKKVYGIVLAHGK